MRIHITDIEDGDILSSDVFNHYGLHVLSKGTKLYKREMSKLLQHQIEFLDIEERSTKDVILKGDSSANPKWLSKMHPLYENAVKSVQTFFSKVNTQGKLNHEEISSALDPLIQNFQVERDVVSMLLLLTNKDNYTYQHSVQVGMLSYYLAVWLNYSETEAAIIGKAGFLHDIGKCRISDDILNKPGKLTSEEYEEVKRHAEYGHQIIIASFNDPYLAVGALQHHERVDGSGYPQGLKGDEIHPVAKIIAVVDVYSAMISSRVYQEEQDLLTVLLELYRLSFNELDPRITHTFIKHMIPNFIGKRVRLNTEEIGIIVMTNPTDFFRPLVKINDDFIDLTIERDYEIKHIYM